MVSHTLKSYTNVVTHSIIQNVSTKTYTGAAEEVINYIYADNTGNVAHRSRTTTGGLIDKHFVKSLLPATVQSTSTES